MERFGAVTDDMYTELFLTVVGDEVCYEDICQVLTMLVHYVGFFVSVEHGIFLRNGEDWQRLRVGRSRVRVCVG